MLRHVQAVRAAWSDETARRRAGRKEWVEVEFLPAALEVIEKPPSPVGRLILWIIVAAAGLALLWSMLANVDTVAVADGRLVPAGRLRSIEAADPGIVRKIAVREGERVRPGQLLIALDPTVADADVEAAQAELQTAALARARANALLHGGRLEAPASMRSSSIEAEAVAVEARRREVEARIAGLRERQAAARATVRVSDANINKLNQTIPIAERQVNAYQSLADKGFGSQIRLNQERERLINLRNDLEVEHARREEAEAQVSAISREIAQAQAEFRSQAARERAEAEGVVATREEELRKAAQRSALQTLRSPIAGIVQEVSVTTIGQVAETGKPLVTIVPEGEPLVLEALVLNKDIASVRVGDPVVVKLEAYPFTRHGTLRGVVAHVSPDSIVDEKRGLVFAATVRLLSPDDPRARRLRPTPGMSATAEIVTGRRRVIDYIWSPLARAVSEAARER